MPLWGQGDEGDTSPEGTGTPGYCWGVWAVLLQKGKVATCPLWDPSVPSCGLCRTRTWGCYGGVRTTATSLGTARSKGCHHIKGHSQPSPGTLGGSSFEVSVGVTVGRERVAVPKEGNFAVGEHQTHCFSPCPGFRGALATVPLHPQTEP